jgi:hypothetical protein
VVWPFSTPTPFFIHPSPSHSLSPSHSQHFLSNAPLQGGHVSYKRLLDATPCPSSPFPSILSPHPPSHSQHFLSNAPLQGGHVSYKRLLDAIMSLEAHNHSLFQGMSDHLYRTIDKEVRRFILGFRV